MNQRPEPAEGVLYVVGTPIGNLGDLSPRAKSILAKVSAVACEDTRRSGRLLNQLGRQGPFFSFHQHNTQSQIPKILQLLREGKSLALISDAGLPGISDPGETLVASARMEGHDVICIPGPCAATTALVSSGIPSSRFCFEGFLPTKNSERRKRLGVLAKEERTTIIYEAPHRLLKLLEELIEFCGKKRPLQVSRELTKKHEHHIGPNIAAALEHFTTNKPIGECTLVLGGHTPTIPQEESDEDLKSQLELLIKKGVSSTEAAKIIAEKSRKSKRYLYDLIHRKA